MDPQAKINHLKSMVVKIVTSFVADFNAVFIFDDAQWYDSQTLDVLMTLSRYCPKIFVQIQTRPLKLSENRILEQTLALPETIHLVLAGFSEQDAIEMIMTKLRSLTVQVIGIDPDILTSILAKTAGSPLFLQMIIDVMFVKIGSDLVVNNNGLVALRDESVHVEAILTDLSAAVLFQFDRLDGKFQRLLKSASVFGQYFNLRDVLDLGNFTMDEMECWEMIRKKDAYNFLKCEFLDPAQSEGPDADGFRKYQFVEGIRILESLVQYVSEANAGALSALANPITPLRRAWWFARLCRGYAALKQFSKEIESGVTALSYLPTPPWPATEVDLKLALPAMKRRAYMNWGDVLFKMAWYSLFLAPSYHKFFVKHAEAVDNGRDHPSYLFFKAGLKCFSSKFLECIPLMMKFFEIARIRGDVPSQHLAMVFCGGVAFGLGDFDFIDETATKFYRTSPTMKDDPMFSFTITNAIYRVAIARGDAEAMAEWKEMFEPRDRVARMYNFGLGMKECIDSWVAVLGGNFASGLKLLEECDKILPRMDMGAQAIDAILTLPYIIALLVDPLRSGVSSSLNVSKWYGAELKRLGDMIASLKSYLKYLGVELDGLPGYKGLFHGVIAKYSNSDLEKLRCADVSRDLFARLKSPLYIRWLNA
ncbi:hypothetical protein HK101_005537 [Irineochytrium annulatum]|nr:hypothetical protein HK101_005537 [Irineochytrium annulatum]